MANLVVLGSLPEWVWLAVFAGGAAGALSLILRWLGEPRLTRFAAHHVYLTGLGQEKDKPLLTRIRTAAGESTMMGKLAQMAAEAGRPLGWDGEQWANVGMLLGLGGFAVGGLLWMLGLTGPFGAVVIGAAFYYSPMLLLMALRTVRRNRILVEMQQFLWALGWFLRARYSLYDSMKAVGKGLQVLGGPIERCLQNWGRHGKYRALDELDADIGSPQFSLVVTILKQAVSMGDEHLVEYFQREAANVERVRVEGQRRLTNAKLPLATIYTGLPLFVFFLLVVRPIFANLGAMILVK